MSNTGLFGKLPCYGDFLSRDLDPAFVDVWDQWLQAFVQGSQEQLGEHWLDTYLTSPIWRFALSSGVVDDNAWAGVMLPSVDRVGRYFPFSIVKKLGVAAPALALHQAASWYDEQEEIALQALEGETSVDELIELVNAVEFAGDDVYSEQAPMESAMGAVISMELEAQNVHAVYPHLLHNLLRQSLQSYSIWNTRGSQLVEPCVFYTRALPQISGAAAMLDGNWQASNWAQPFLLNTEEESRALDEFTQEDLPSGGGELP